MTYIDKTTQEHIFQKLNLMFFFVFPRVKFVFCYLLFIFIDDFLYKKNHSKTKKDRHTDRHTHSNRHSGQTKTDKKYRHRQTDIEIETKTDRLF